MNDAEIAGASGELPFLSSGIDENLFHTSDPSRVQLCLKALLLRVEDLETP